METDINLAALFHESDSRFSYPLGDHEALFCLLAAKDDPNIDRVSIIYQGKFRGIKDQKKVKMEVAYSDTLHDYYQVKLHLPDVRILYVFELIDKKGNVIYFSEAGASKEFEMGETCYNAFQLPYINPKDIIKVNEKFKDRIFYQIFPDRFARDESIPHSKSLMKWGDKPSIYNYAGGNIRGIINKLDYLKGLGIGAIYLNPLWKGSTNHKYDTISYGEVDPDFGKDEDLVELIKLAHEKDILVVLDMVYNHMSYLNPIFQDVVAKGKTSPYYNWFMIKGEYPSFEKGNYESFGVHPYMPKINLNDEDCLNHFIKLSLEIIDKYDPDGFRLDVGDEVAHYFWRKLHHEVNLKKKDFLLTGEDWHNAESFLNQGDQFDSTMNYAVMRLAKAYFIDKSIGAKRMKEETYGVFARYKESINHNLLNLLDSHDKVRLINEANLNKDVYLSAYCFLLFYPGLPSIYYGDEVGLEGKDNIDCRRCFPWEETKQDQEILSYFKRMISIRNSFPISEAKMQINSVDGLLKITYELEDRKLTVYWNNSSQGKYLNIIDPILSLNYENSIIKEDGFLIELKQ